MAEDMLYKPREIYTRFLQRQLHDEADKWFDDMVAAAKVDKEGNAKHVEAYNAAKLEEEAAAKKAKSGSALATFMLVMGIIFAIVLIGIIFLVLYFTKFKKMKAERAEILEKAKAKTKAALDVCYADMAALNASFDWNMPCKILEKASTLLELDPLFKTNRMQQLINGFEYKEDDNYLHSVIGSNSGAINGNPFFLERVYECEIRDKTYTGSIVITWTTTHRDSDGHTHTDVHTQTLIATIERPAPFYEKTTRLVYGNDAAPKLEFSRYPSGVSGKSEKEIASYVKSKVKDLEKQEKKAIKKGENFTKMGNDEFDALFGATDRNNEVEFRLLFTPLAQTNMINLIKNPEPFGDDFVMVKDKKITSVASRHSQSFDYSANPNRFVGYDVVAMKQAFVGDGDDFTKFVYFYWAPMMSIPLYQMHRSNENLDYGKYPSNFTKHEQETMINGLNESLFRPKNADESLPVMLKAVASTASGKDDIIQVLGTSYVTTPQVELVPKIGGDGHTHMVPVPWTEYTEVQKVSFVAVGEVGSTAQEAKGKMANLPAGEAYYERGLASKFLGEKPNNSFAEVRKVF